MAAHSLARLLVTAADSRANRFILDASTHGHVHALDSTQLTKAWQDTPNLLAHRYYIAYRKTPLIRAVFVLSNTVTMLNHAVSKGKIDLRRNALCTRKCPVSNPSP